MIVVPLVACEQALQGRVQDALMTKTDQKQREQIFLSKQIKIGGSPQDGTVIPTSSVKIKRLFL